MNWKIKGTIIGLALFILTYFLYIFGFGFWPLGLLIEYAPSLIFAAITFIGSGFFIGWLVDSIRDETPAFTCFVTSLAAAFFVLVTAAYSAAPTEPFSFLLGPVYIIWTILALILPNLIGWLYAKFVGDYPIEDVTKGFFTGLITGIVFALSLLTYLIYFTITSAYVYGFGTEGNIQYGISSQLLYWVFINDSAGLFLIAALVVPVAIASLIGWIVGKIRG